LAVLGLRALLQERDISEQQWRTRLDHATTSAGADLTRELDEWTSAIGRASRSAVLNQDLLPQALRRAVTEPGVAAIVISGAAPVAWPERALAYNPWAADVPTLPAPELLAAETIELGGVDSAKAIGQYQHLLQTAKADDRAWLLHRLARASFKAHQASAAAEALDALERLRGFTVDGLPADFLARYERCVHTEAMRSGLRATGAVAVLRDLTEGRWVLDSARYHFYVSRLRDWAVGGAPPAEIQRLDAIRSRREALTGAIVDFAATDRAGAFLVLHGSERGIALPAIVIDSHWLLGHVQSVVTAPSTTGTGLVAAVHLVPGDESANESEKASGDLSASRRVSAGGLTWRIDVQPENPLSAFTDLRRRQRIYLAMLAGVVAVMAFGTYLTSRVVRRELEVARMKSDFVAAVSHEFRSPLSGIRQLGEMLMRGRVPTEARRQEYYERITHESNRLSRVVDNLLDFTRMEEGRRPFSFERVDLAEWLRSTVKSFEAQEAHRTHRVAATIDDTLPAAGIDREALATALDNVLDNAVKYSPGSETVWLDAERDGRGIVIRVRDQGVGIALADQPHVFDRFYRGMHGEAKTVRGTGLGLSLVRHIVRAHGGRVTLASVPGAGTTVSIHLKADA
jgi:signal transduction histidine kinase